MLSYFGSVEKWENAVNSEFVQTPSVNTESVQMLYYQANNQEHCVCVLSVSFEINLKHCVYRLGHVNKTCFFSDLCELLVGKTAFCTEESWANSL